MNAQRASARTLAKLERKRQQAEAMGEKARAIETGEDLERKKNWEYSIEDNERWDKKLARKERRADYSFTGQLARGECAGPIADSEIAQTTTT